MRYILTTIFLLIVSLTYSQYYVREYTYNASENDSKIEAKEYALLGLKKNLIEELGVLVNNSTNLNINNQTDFDNIILNTHSQTISECITQTKILKESWDGEHYYIKVKIYVNKKELIKRLKRISKETKPRNPTPHKEPVKKDKIYFYGSFDINIHQLNDDNFKEKTSTMAGVTIGALFNENILLGIYGNANTENKYNDSLSKNLRYNDGGVVLGLRFFKKSPVKLFIPVRLGIGSIKYYDNEWTIIEENEDNYFIINGGVGLEIKLAEILKLGIDCNYKLTDDIKLPDTPNNILNGWNINISLKIIY